MAQNDFKPFAIGAGANVTAQADWELLAALATGFQSGKASSAQINKAIRQASFIAAALAQYTSDKTGGDVLDDGDQAAFISKMAAAFGKDFQPLDATLTALAALTGVADKLAYFNGDDTAALTALTAVGRDIIGKSSIADVLTYLGLGDLPTFGDAASKNVGTTAGTVAAGDDSRIVNAVQASNPGLCTAWVNFNGVGGATIRTSNNVSSVTRLSTGRYQITFTTPMSSANYVAMLTIGDGGGTGTAAPVVMLSGSVITGEPIKDANSITIGVRGNAQAAYDASEINAAFFGGK
ncbi:Uncharacterised protein [Kluyvera ascorbata]|uniref:phage tail protein n=1 Tax=Kluyvera ascorbata TaxID=51288 RepID=UPI000E031EDA|nr:phage tail protein [Kluyvera ascorbata]STW99162.1 Uncharacterised protein [Kluyvera ascorbata]